MPTMMQKGSLRQRHYWNNGTTNEYTILNMSLRTQYDTTMKTLDDVKGKPSREGHWNNRKSGDLRTELQKLRELRNDVNRRVNVAERQQMRRLDQVQGWLSRVEAMETEVTQLIGDGAETIDEKGLCGSCYPKHCISCYKLGKKVVRKLQQVATLMSEGRLEVVADSVPPDLVEEIPSEPTVGLESTFDTVWRSLGEEHNEIWEKVGFCDDKWKIKSRHVKAKDIWKALSKKRFVVLLDDLWEQMDLLEVGIPPPYQQNKSKLIFTTRSLDLCGQMGAQKKIKVKSLAWKDSWDLFKKICGRGRLNSDPEIPELAEIVARVLRFAVDEFDDMDGAKNQGFNIISTLVHACLLDETSDAYRVKLHDVIRDMAVWITGHMGEMKGKFLVQTKAGLTQAPEFHKWRMAERISLMANQIEKLMGSPTCPNLSTLLLDFNSDLKMISNDGNESLVEELDSLKYLTTLCTTIASAAVLKRFLSSKKLLSCTHALCLKIFNGSNSLNLSSLQNIKHLTWLRMEDFNTSREISFDWVGKGKEIVEYSNLSSMVECFHCLGTVHIYRCQMLKNLTWLIFAPNLLYLTIEECDNLEELIGKGAKDGGNLSPFTKLIPLQLFCLPQLKSLYWNPLPFLHLDRIVVGSCPKLKKLPLNSSSAKQHRCVIRGEEEWWNELEWRTKLL
ncbi:putative disease resistance protein [Vitis vinifera]|uniref:Putative disease resistance protein n=1 Tax=Vitis vinifera TaxID=29760 RepID=A0A438G381_VITVI|nr:putative disease resistance protein [Vitis vinifera]